MAALRLAMPPLPVSPFFDAWERLQVEGHMGEMSKTAEAGRRGPDVRSDAWVQIALRESGGLELQVKSKVESMYGEAVRGLIGDMLGAFGVKRARVELEDAGAVPFVLMARIEAAVRRLGVDVGEGYLPERAAGTDYGTERERFRRSRLYLPGNEPKFMLNAGLHRPDGLILDLEDSVAPAVKDEARLLVRNALRSIDFLGAERMVRINQGQRGLEDLDCIVPHNVHVILLPKVETAEHVRAADRRIAEILKAKGISRPVYLMPIVESALGAINAYEIATASPNICALTIGLEDYTADIGTQRTNEGRESFWARCQVVNAARAAGIPPIDTVFSDINDMDGLRASVLEAKGLGFEGKGCIHPRQIAVIHEAFAPAPVELEKAQKIVAAFEEAQAKGLGVVALGSKMIDPPVVKRALRVVRLAEAMHGQ
ncbi:MAG TPA: aldolase/citrate lyase family protein [Phycisphaerae bacterium]|nr:aldolase/citrate lyase family protein [Phycisphaerae bacterium]HNU44729.1 aldolase/citrate lyase family protein [Phycisphaerae bacterium]